MVSPSDVIKLWLGSVGYAVVRFWVLTKFEVCSISNEGKHSLGWFCAFFLSFFFPLGRKCAGWDLQSSMLKGMLSNAFWQVHFSWKADHLLLHGYFRMKYLLLFNWANPTTQTFLPPPLRPSSLQREWLWRPEWLQLKDSQVAETPPRWHVPSSGGPASLLGQSKETFRLF